MAHANASIFLCVIVDWPAPLVVDLAPMNCDIQLVTCPKLSRSAWYWHDGMLVETSIHQTLRMNAMLVYQPPSLAT